MTNSCLLDCSFLSFPGEFTYELQPVSVLRQSKGIPIDPALAHFLPKAPSVSFDQFQNWSQDNWKASFPVFRGSNLWKEQISFCTIR
jgi:hypothetical protein